MVGVQDIWTIRRNALILAGKWTTVAADEIWNELVKRYSIEGVPQYMLLDRKGRLVADNSEVDLNNGFEQLLEGVLD